MYLIAFLKRLGSPGMGHGLRQALERHRRAAEGLDAAVREMLQR